MVEVVITTAQQVGPVVLVAVLAEYPALLLVAQVLLIKDTMVALLAVLILLHIVAVEEVEQAPLVESL